MLETKKQTKKRRPRAETVNIPVIRITNPFNPKEFVREELKWSPTKTLADYFPLPTTDVVISINGKIVERDKFALTYLDKTDNMVVCPVPTGGGSGKQILAIAAMIAVTVFAPEVAIAMNSAMGLELGATGMMALRAGVTIAGSLLVSSVFAPPKPTRNAATTSSSYGADGAKNTSLEGIVVPVCYGEFRMAGNVLGLHVESDADDNQSLYMLLSAGEGPIASISEIQINDNPLSDYKDVEVQTRLGLPNQTPIPWFQDNIVAVNKGAKLGEDWTYTTTTTAVDKLRLDFTAPNGLCEIDEKDGSSKTRSVDLDIQFRPAGTGDWKPMPVTNEVVAWDSVTGVYDSSILYDADSGRPYQISQDGSIVYLTQSPTIWRSSSGALITNEAQLQYLKENPPEPEYDAGGNVILTNRLPYYSQQTTISAAKRSTVRRSFATDRLTAGKYDIRVRRITPKAKKDTIIEEIYLADVNEITLDTMTYPNTALLALKIKMSDQISGVPRVTFLHGGRLIQVNGRPLPSSTSDQWFDAASKNPAWVVWDMLTHRRYGGAMPASRLDFQAFKAWADYCDQKNLQWNGPIDTEMNVWDAAQLPLRVGHSQLVNVGTRYTVVTEKPSTPVMMFSVANMIEGSYKETWLGTNDRANEIDVSFFDKTDNYKQRTVKIYDPAALAAGAKQRSSAITLYGVTDYETAYKEGQFQLNLNRFILKTIGFSAPLEAVACSVGDLIYVQHDMTDWAVAGRFNAGSTTSSAKLDRDVTMVAGKQYKLLILQDAIQRASGTISNVVGASLFLTGFAGDQPIKRIKIGTRDLRVASTFSQGSGYGVILDEAVSGITPGSAYTLWDTDVIEERNVVNVPGTTATLTLQTPASSAPVQFGNWMFGESDKVKKPFRVKSISGSHDYQRDITAIEYRPEVYDFDRYGSNVPVVPGQTPDIGPARNLAVYEETYISGSNIVSNVVASWSSPQAGLYAGADVYVQKNDGQLERVEIAKNRTSAVISAAKGDKVKVKVVAFDVFDKRSQFELAPSSDYTVIGEIPDINVGGVTGAAFTWAGRDCKINWRYNSVTHSYEFGSEPTGADAGALDPHFKDYEVSVYDKTHMTLRRKEYTTDNSYVYIYDKNFADGLSRHLVFEVRMRDTFNNLGKPVVLDAYNPPPKVTSFSSTTTFESATVSYTHSDDPDFAGALVWISDRQADLAGDTPADAFLAYKGPDSSVLLPKLMFAHDYYVKIAAYDAFGPTELLPTATMHIKTTNLNVDAIADGVLKDSKLIPDLKNRIDLIDAPPSVDGSVAKRLADEALARTTAITAETAARTDAILAEAKARDAAITTESTIRKSATESLATQITTVTAAVNNNAAAIVNEANARTTATESLATQINTVAASTASNTAAITNESKARTTATDSLAAQISTVSAKTDQNTAAIVTESKARTTATDSLATQINTVSAKTDLNTAAITTEATARTTATESLATQINTVSAKTDQNTAAIATESKARTTANDAMASRIDTIAVSVANNAAAIQSEATSRADAISAEAYQRNLQIVNFGNDAQAYVQSYSYSKAQADSAISTQVNQVSARLNNLGGVTLEQKFTAQADVNKGLLGQYTIKIDNNGYVSGFGLSSTLVNGTPTSEFAVNANAFSVVTGGGKEYPFTIGTVNGVTKTIIKDVIIGDGAINNAKIGNAQVNTLKIGANSVTVPTLLSGYGGVSGLGPGGEVEVGSQWVYFQDAASLAIIGNWQSQASANTNSGMKVYVDGVAVLNWSDSANGGYAQSHACSGKTTVSAGNHLLRVSVTNGWNAGAWDLTNWSVLFLGVMR